MFSATGYQLLDSFTFEYYGIEKYDNKEYFKYLFADAGYYILAPTRNITKVTFPFDGYFLVKEIQYYLFQMFPKWAMIAYMVSHQFLRIRF